MRINFTFLQRASFAGLILFGFNLATAQTPQPLSLKDFAIWGGSADATSFNSNQGVVLRNSSFIQGNIGSNHFITVRNSSEITGNIHSGNGINIGVASQITGNVFASNLASNFPGPAIFSSVRTIYNGNISANGIIEIRSLRTKLSMVNGQVSVPAPTQANYKGPIPSGGLNNSINLPTLPIMPNLTTFDDIIGTQNITTTRTISPGAYRNLELRGKQTLTFDGPGNYIFDEVFNRGANELIFDFKNTTEGNINIFIKKEAQWSNITVSAVNGDFTSRIFTEVHGDGTKRRNPADGVAFEVRGNSAGYPDGKFLWLGNVYAPNGGILVRATKFLNRPHIMGALWSGTRVDINDVIRLIYTPPAPTSIAFIDPYYAPPAQGKVSNPDNIIGAELTSLSNAPDPIISIENNEIFNFDEENKVLIEVISKQANDNTLKLQLKNMGMTDTVGNGPHSFLITGYFPINMLSQLNDNPLIEYVRPWYPPVNNAGQVTTQGDATMRSNLVRQRFGLDGTGVKIGVISDSYNAKASAQNDVDQGDLPGIKSSGQPNLNPEPVQVLQDLSQRGKDEGRAMLQIVHDIAPKAKLAFRTGFLSVGDFAKGILELADPNLEGGKCDIIVDDLSYITEPFLKDGVVAQVVDQVTAQGVTYFTSAGNFGQRSHEGIFNGVSNPSVIPAPAQIHKFGSTDSEIYQSILLKPGNYTIVLQWDDASHSLGDPLGVSTDLDLYLLGANNFRLFGFNRSNLFKDPFEVCPFTVREETIAKLMIVRAAGNTDVRFKYIIFRGDATILDYNTNTSTVVGHANSNGAISVGAMFYENRPGVTPIWPAVSSFSSRGGTFTRENNSFITRNKPDIIAPNGVNTTVNLGGAFFDDGDDYPNFFGTSAAAPHAAAVGALIVQGRKKFNQQVSVSPEEIRQQLISSAGKFSYLPDNFSFEGGFGFVQADEAILEIANARPILDTLKAEIAGSENGSEPFNVILKGRYIVDNTQIYVNNQAVPTTISEDKTEARALVNAIPQGEDPSFQLFNPAKSLSGEDGGFSEERFFFSERRIIVVKANNKTRRYQQDNPIFDYEVTVNGTPLASTNLTLSDLQLNPENLSIYTIATKQSKSGLYRIFIERAEPLDLDDPLNSQYEFIFESGTLNLQKMLLRITPRNKTIKYGEFVGDIDYRYEFDVDNNGIIDEGEGEEEEEREIEEEDEEVAESDRTFEILQEIKRLHKEYLAENAVIVVNGFEDNNLTNEDLKNISTLSSFQSLNKAKRYIVENGRLVPVSDELSPNQIGEQRFIIETPLEAFSKYITDPVSTTLSAVDIDETNYKGFLSIKSLSQGSASARLPEEPLTAMINGQLMGMISGETEKLVETQFLAEINGYQEIVDDIVFENGQLRALVNSEYIVVPNGQLWALVNGEETYFDLTVVNGQLRALVNGLQEMQFLNGQLRALVNEQEVSIANGQLRAMVNGQLVPLVNNELVGIVNGQLKALVNGEMAALINGQLLALVNGEYEEVTELTLANGQLRALVNGQLRALVNGQLKAMVNGEITDIDNNNLVLENGQLRAMVNGQLRAMVNGQLKALVNGQLRALVNVEAVGIEKVVQQSNGQLKALVNGKLLPIRNGQLRAMVNGQLRALVNGELMAEEEGQMNFTVFENGQLKAMVNGQLKALVNGQLKAMVNGQLRALVNGYAIENGQLKALVNGEEWVFPNGQLKALVNGQLQPLVNNFDISGTNNNEKTMVLIDESDVVLQRGDIGGMIAMPMVSGLNAGQHYIFPAALINENFEVTYETGALNILPAPLFVKTFDETKTYGDENPGFSKSISGAAYGENIDFQENDNDGFFTNATTFSSVGLYPINAVVTVPNNYTVVKTLGDLTIMPKLLTVTANDISVEQSEGGAIPELTISYDGLVGDDTDDDVCSPVAVPGYVHTNLGRTFTYSNVLLNSSSKIFNAEPGEQLTLTGSWIMEMENPDNPACPGCITQLYIGMGNGAGGNHFTDCFDVSGTDIRNGIINKTLTAPLLPGVYYITQRVSWFYFCYQEFQDGNPLEKIIHDQPVNIIAMVIVEPFEMGENKISASIEVDPGDAPGDYPITLTGCANYNPNYTLQLVNGTFTILAPGGSIEESGSSAKEASDAAQLQAKELIPQKQIITKDQVFPSPASSTIRLQLIEDVKSTNDIQIVDVMGKLNRTSTRKIDDGDYEINISGLRSGIYFIQARTATGIKSFKFMKM